MDDWVLLSLKPAFSWCSHLVCPRAECLFVVRILYQLNVQVLKQRRRLQGLSFAVSFGIEISLIVRIYAIVSDSECIQLFRLIDNKRLRRFRSICVLIFNLHSILFLVRRIKVFDLFWPKLNIWQLEVLKTVQFISWLERKKLRLVWTVKIQCLKFWRVLRRLLQLSRVVRGCNLRS